MCFKIQDETTASTIKPTSNSAFKNSLTGFSAAAEGDFLVMGGPTAYNGCGILSNCLRSDIYRCRYSNKYHVKATNEAAKDIITECDGWNEGWATQVGKYKAAGGDQYIATSSPKAERYKGQVHFYRKLLNEWERPLHILYGNEIGAVFGYSLVSADVDGDGVTDLLVGAPFATDDTKMLRDAGKVFVYHAPLAQYASVSPKDILVGKDSGDRFGTSLACLGDVNLDGYEDIAVGAPYGGVDRKGVVYIYNGGDTGIHTSQPMVLTPSEYMPGGLGFGFSLDGGLDMDLNGYPDMVIGAVHSDTAVLVRASPVVTLQGSVFFDAPTINIKENLCPVEMAGNKKLRGVCFDLKVEITYTSLPTFRELKLTYDMEVGIDNTTTTSRFGFVHNTAKRTERNMTVYKDGTSSRWALKVFVQRARSNVNLTVSAKVSVRVADYEPKDLPPVLNILSPTTFTTSTKLACKNTVTTCSTEPDLALSAFGTPVTLGETPTTLSLNVSLEVKNDPAYGIKIRVVYPEHLVYQSVDGKGVLPDCRKMLLKKELTCIIDESNADETIDFWLDFHYDMSDVETLLAGATFSLRANNDVKTDTNLSNNHVQITIPAKTNATLYPQGFSDPEGVIVTVNQTATEDDLKAVQENTGITFSVDKLGPRLDHIFSLNNRGPSPVMNAKLMFHLPLYLGAARLIYFMEQPTASPGVTCTDVKINPLGLQPPQSPVSSVPSLTTSSSIADESQPQHQRDKRDVEETTSSSTDSSSTYSSSTIQWTTDPAEYFSTTLDPIEDRKSENENALECRDPKCLVTCNVKSIPDRQSISVNFSSYLVTATVNKLVLRKVFVRTWVTAEVAQSGSTVINPEIHAKTEVLLVRPPKRGFLAVPIWMYILAVVVAILFIIIIVCALRTAGFFKRERPPSTVKRETLVEEKDHHSDINKFE